MFGTVNSWTPELSRAAQVRRVLMTADSVGGVWPYCLDLATALRARRVETTLAVMGPQPDESQRADAARRGVRLMVAPYKLEWAESPWEDVARAGNWLLDLEATHAPEIVHLNGFCHAALPWKSAPIVVAHSCVRSWWRAVHGTGAPSQWDRYTAAVTAGLHAARVVIAPSRAMLSALHDEYSNFRSGCVIPNGSALVDQMDDAEPLKDNIVLAAGRLWDPAKNISALRDVAHDLRWRVCIAGQAGDDMISTEPAANVTYLGRLTAQAMRRWHARAAIYALPAQYEPFGLSILEAAASGCALVLGDIPSLRENWSGAAVFVPPTDRRALALAIGALIDNPPARRRLARRARARARRFTITRMADAYWQVYFQPHTAVA